MNDTPALRLAGCESPELVLLRLLLLLRRLLSALRLAGLPAPASLLWLLLLLAPARVAGSATTAQLPVGK
jgi:hypothetical protein